MTRYNNPGTCKRCKVVESDYYQRTVQTVIHCGDFCSTAPNANPPCPILN
jgi:predicted phosphodiesterase